MVRHSGASLCYADGYAMKVVLKPIKGFRVETEDGKNLGQFVKVGEWNGMTELKQNGSVLIIDSGSPYQEMMDRMFDSDAEQTVDVVKASPDIIATMNAPHFDRT